MSRADAMKYMRGRSSRRAGDNRLPALAEEIKKSVGEARQHADASLAAGIDAGDRLLEAKALCRHGEWLPWLKEHVSISERTAQVYMQLARDKETIKSAGSADLTIEAALQAAHNRSTVEALAKSINDKWAEATDNRREFVRCLGEVRECFKEEGDDAFKRWLTAATSIGPGFANKIPALLTGEYDDEAWTEAMFGDIEEMLSGAAE